MCEQAARYCRDGVHKLLNKEQAKLRAQESREQPKPVAGQDSESATAAQSGNSGAQPGGFDGLVRWIVTKMSDNKNISSREYASSKEDVAVAQEQFFAPEPRRGISVILDVSIGRSRAVALPSRDVGGRARWVKITSERCARTGAVRTYAREPSVHRSRAWSSEPSRGFPGTALGCVRRCDQCANFTASLHRGVVGVFSFCLCSIQVRGAPPKRPAALHLSR